MALYVNGTEHTETSPLYFNGTGVDIVNCNGTRVWRFAKDCYVRAGIRWNNAINTQTYGTNLITMSKKASAYQMTGNLETGVGSYRLCEDATDYSELKNYTGTYDGKTLTFPYSSSSCDDTTTFTGKVTRRKVFPRSIFLYVSAWSDRAVTNSARISRAEINFSVGTLSKRSYSHWVNVAYEQTIPSSSCGEDDETEIDIKSRKARYGLYSPSRAGSVGSISISKTVTLTGEGAVTQRNDFTVLSEPVSTNYDIADGEVTSITHTALNCSMSGTVYFTSGKTETFSDSIGSFYWGGVQEVSDSILYTYVINRDTSYTGRYIDAD